MLDLPADCGKLEQLLHAEEIAGVAQLVQGLIHD